MTTNLRDIRLETIAGDEASLTARREAGGFHKHLCGK